MDGTRKWRQLRLLPVALRVVLVISRLRSPLLAALPAALVISRPKPLLPAVRLISPLKSLLRVVLPAALATSDRSDPTLVPGEDFPPGAFLQDCSVNPIDI